VAEDRRIEERIIPYCPRPQFEAYHNRKQRYAVVVAHRRAGKTVCCINDLVKRSLECELPDPRHAYVAPLFGQAKDLSWEYLKRYAAPVTVETYESELRVDLVGGRRVRLYGADNPDRLRGIYLDGVVLDEYAVMKPRVWGEVIRPALSDRQGWATFIGTPAGRTGLFDIWTEAGEDPESWYRLMLKASESGITGPEELADSRRRMTPEQYEQEYECSFEAAVIGSIFGKRMAEADADKRICGVPYDPNALVSTAWDLGHTDATAIWFAQVCGREIHVIDFYENSNMDLGHYVAKLREKPYNYGSHIFPQDVKTVELGSGKSRLQILQELGVKPHQIASVHRVEEGLNAANQFIPRCWFDATKCKEGIERLRLYRRDWDANRKAFKPTPVHDWTSHASDAFRYLAWTLDRAVINKGFSRDIEYPKHGVA
jgi:phage terminase large subunit